MSRTYKVAFANVELRGMFGAAAGVYRQALLADWQPGARTTRYNRTWRISAPHPHSEDVLTGRIGFVSEDELDTLEWNEGQQDFVRGQASGGIVIPFAVHAPRRLVAFQLVTGQVRPTSFTGAFESLLNESRSPYLWSVQQLVEQADYRAWAASVERVTYFSFRIEKPNPHYHDNDVAEQLL